MKSLNTNTIVCNLFGGPGCGKSSLAAGVYHLLKIRGVSCELIAEFAKDAVWDNAQSLFDNQLFIFANQHHRLFRVMGKVDVLIVDSPLLLPLIYGAQLNNEEFNALVVREFFQYKNINFLLERGDIKYDPIGRNQDEPQAKNIDKQVLTILEQHCVQYDTVKVSERDDAHIFIAGRIMDRLDEIRRS